MSNTVTATFETEGAEKFKKAAAILEGSLEKLRKKTFQSETARTRKQVAQFQKAGLDKVKIEEFVQLSRGRAFDKHLRPAFKNVAAMAGEADEQIGKFDHSLDAAINTAKGLKKQSQSLADQIKTYIEGYTTQADQTKILFKAGEEAFKSFQSKVGGGMTDLFKNVFKNGLDNFKADWRDFTGVLESSFKDTLARMASAIVQENLMKPAIALGGKALAGGLDYLTEIFAFAKGGLVKKPTLAMLGEAGPELVVPLGEIESVFTSIARRTVIGAGGDAAQAAAIRAAGEEGAALAGQNYTADLFGSKLAGGSATVAAIAAALTLARGGSGSDAGKNALKSGVTSFIAGGLGGGMLTAGGFGAGLALMAVQNREALKLNENRDKVNEQVLDKFFGLGAFGKRGLSPEEYGRRNINAIRDFTTLAEGAPGLRGKAERTIEDAVIAFTGGDPNYAEKVARAIGARRFDSASFDPDSGDATPPRPSIKLHEFLGVSPEAFRALSSGEAVSGLKKQIALVMGEGDEEGRYYTQDTVRRVHKGEHTLNLNHPTSQRALNEAVANAMNQNGGGHTTINVDMRGAYFPDRRTMNRFYDDLEDIRRGRRRYGRGSS